MPMNVAVQMDPIETINIVGDSTFALMLECQRRGHRLFYYQPGALALRDGHLTTEGRDVTVRDEAGRHAELGPLRRVDLAAFDVVLMRQDPPFDMNYITATHLLERIIPKMLVVNDPAEVRNAPEKLFVTRYLDLTPPTLITRSPTELRQFRSRAWRHHPEAALWQWRRRHLPSRPRPTRISRSLLELFSQMFREPFIAQRYLPRCARATSASSWSTASRSVPSTACRRPASHAPTCMSAAAPSRPS